MIYKNNETECIIINIFIIIASIIILFGIIYIFHEYFSDYQEPSPPQICILTRVRNIPNLLPQWLNYHTIIGVNRFIIADLCSTDTKTPMILREFEDQNIITYLKPQDLNLNCSSVKLNENTHFSNLLRYSPGLCDWVTVIDPDEYIFPVDDPKEVSFLPGLLRDQTLIRMPWYLMSTHGRERRTSGLIIERFKTGMMINRIKSFVKTSSISYWQNTHYPIFRHINMTFGEHPFVYDWEMDMNQACPRPKVSPIYLRHFQGLSWQEFIERRGPRNRTSANLRAKNARGNWLRYNFTSTCPAISEEFRKKIAILLGSPEPEPTSRL